jgi:hypothetical protein
MHLCLVGELDAAALGVELVKVEQVAEPNASGGGEVEEPGCGGGGERELHDGGEGPACVAKDEEEVCSGGDQHREDKEPGQRGAGSLSGPCTPSRGRSGITASRRLI